MGVCETSLRADKSKKEKKGSLNLIYFQCGATGAHCKPSAALSLNDDVMVLVFAKRQYQSRMELWTMDQCVYPGATNRETITTETEGQQSFLLIACVTISKEKK